MTWHLQKIARFPQQSGMQVVLDEFNEWTNNNKLSMNPSKYQAFQVCFKTNAAVNGKLELTLLKGRQRFDTVSTSNLKV